MCCIFDLKLPRGSPGGCLLFEFTCTLLIPEHLQRVTVSFRLKILQFIFRNPNFTWSYDHDILMCQEVLDIELYQFKLRSPESGKAWETISSHLNATSHLNFSVTH